MTLRGDDETQTDLTETLRTLSELHEIGVFRTSVIRAAADEIESLRVELSAVRQQRDNADDQLNRLAEWNSNQARMIAAAEARAVAAEDALAKQQAMCVRVHQLLTAMTVSKYRDNADWLFANVRGALRALGAVMGTGDDDA